MSRLDLSSIPVLTGTGYPEAFAEAVNGRSKQVLGEAGGLSQFGVNLVELQPGAASSQRHWHTHEDEFVMVVSGELTLITDEGETLMRAGDCLVQRGTNHAWSNRSNAPCLVAFVLVSANPL